MPSYQNYFNLIAALLSYLDIVQISYVTAGNFNFILLIISWAGFILYGILLLAANIREYKIDSGWAKPISISISLIIFVKFTWFSV